MRVRLWFVPLALLAAVALVPGCTSTWATATKTPTAAPPPSNTPVPTATPWMPSWTRTNTMTPLPSNTASRTRTFSNTRTNTTTPTHTISTTPTNSPVPSNTDTATAVPTNTDTATALPTATETPTPLPPTSTDTPTPPPPTSTDTPTSPPTSTDTPTPAGTATATTGMILIAAGLSDPYEIAVDGGGVYWTESTGMSVKRAPLAGGTPTPLASSPRQARTIGQDATYVYWCDYAPTPTSNVLWRVAKAGGTPQAIASYPDVTNANGMVVDATDVYWTDVGNMDIRRVPIAGGTVTPIFSLGGGSLPAGLDSDGTYLYYADYNTGMIGKLAKAVGTPICSSGPWCGPWDLAFTPVNGGEIWFLEYGCQRLCKLNSTCGLTGIIVQSIPNPIRIVLDGSEAFWTENTSTGKVEKCPLSSPGAQTPTPVAAGQNLPMGLALDASYVYWAEQGAGNVWRAPK